MKQGITILLTIVAVAVIGGGAYWLGRSSGSKNATVTTTNTPAVADTNAAVNTNVTTALSEQPDQATYDAYFSDAFLGKMPANKTFDPSLFTRTTTYTQADKFCTSLTVRQDLAVGQLATATYNSGTKQFIRPKAIFQHAITVGNSIGCEDLALNTGAYEYKIYANDKLAIVLPFRVE